MQNLRIGFTGYRPEKLWGSNLHDAHYQHLSNQLLATIKQLINRYHAQKITANCGLARGADTVFCLHDSQVKSLRGRFDCLVPVSPTG